MIALAAFLGLVAFAFAAEARVARVAVWSLEGDQTDARCGTVASAGDVNNDGYDDVIVGSYSYDHPEVDEGWVRLFLGGPAGLSATPVWSAEGNQPGAKLGDKLSTAGDVNGDGYDDVILGAAGYSNGQAQEGAAFLYLGSAQGLSPAPVWSQEGNQAGGEFGANVAAAGDVNGDGYDDVIIGGWLYDSGQLDEGKAWVYLGSPSGLASTPVWTGESNSVSAIYGYRARCAGDLNADGFDDIVVGARRYSGDGLSKEGRVYVYFGSPSGPSVNPSWTHDGDQADIEFGSSIGQAGDVDGDGYDDLLVAAFRYDGTFTDQGRAYLFRGGPTGPAAAPSWVQTGDQADMYFAYHIVGAGDFNRDGYADVWLGSALYDAGPLVDAGKAYLYLGGPSGLATAPSWTLAGDQSGGQFANAVGAAGDVNGDGYSDVMAGALYRDNAWVDAGRAELFLGGPAETTDAPRDAALSPDLRVIGPNPTQAGIRLSLSLAVDSAVDLDIHDISGRVLHRRSLGTLSRGQHALSWDGVCPSGAAASAGSYVARVRTAGGPSRCTFSIIR